MSSKLARAQLSIPHIQVRKALSGVFYLQRSIIKSEYSYKYGKKDVAGHDVNSNHRIAVSMLEDTLKMLPAIDQIANGNHLLMLKAALNYLPQPGQQFMALFIKASELTNILGYYQSVPDVKACCMEHTHTTPSDMLQDLRSYCSHEEQASIDQCIQMMQMISLYTSLKDDGDTTDFLKNILSPEQQSLFESCQEMF